MPLPDTAEQNQAFTLAQRRAFMTLSVEERRRRMAEQAQQMMQHYESEEESAERQHWQGGDIAFAIGELMQPVNQ